MITRMELLGLVLVAVFVLLVTCKIYNMHLEKRKYPPGPYGVPLLGYIPFLGRYFHVGFANLRKKYGNVVSVRLGRTTVVILNDFEAIREALVVQGDTFNGRGKESRFAEIKQKDILFSDEPKWKERKRYVMRTLSDLGVGRSSIESDILFEVDKLSDYLKANHGQPIEMLELMFLPMLNIACNLAYGKRYEPEDKEVQLIKDGLKNIQFPRIRTKFLPILKIIYGDTVAEGCQQILGYVKYIIDGHEKNSNLNEPNNFTSTFLAEIRRTERKNGAELAPFTRSHLVGYLADMLMAGVETNETTLLFLLLYIALYPEVQRKVQQELDGLMTIGSALPMTSKALAPYTQATIMEVQRCGSTVPLGVVHSTIRDTVLLGHNIPKNTLVITNLYAVHNDERHWGDPNVFRPERFLDVNGKAVNDDHLIPFSIGGRQCMGIALAKTTVFVFFTCLLRRFTFSLVEGQPKPSLEPGTVSVIIKPKPFSLIVTGRD